MKYMIKAFTMNCSHLHPTIQHQGTSLNLFCHQTTHLTYQAAEMAMRVSAFRHGWASVSMQCQCFLRRHVSWCIWLWSTRLRKNCSGNALKGFYSAATSAGWFSFPSKTLEGLFYNTHSRQATLLLSHSNYSLFIHSSCMFCKIVFNDYLNVESK